MLDHGSSVNKQINYLFRLTSLLPSSWYYISWSKGLNYTESKGHVGPWLTPNYRLRNVDYINIPQPFLMCKKILTRNPKSPPNHLTDNIPFPNYYYYYYYNFVTQWLLQWLGNRQNKFNSWKGPDIFLLFKISRMVMGLMQPPVEWVMGVHYLGVNCPHISI